MVFGDCTYAAAYGQNNYYIISAATHIHCLTMKYCLCVAGSLGKEAVLSANHALARRHHLLEGHVFNQLAQAFKEEGKKCRQVSVGDNPSHVGQLQFYTTCDNRLGTVTI